jgi:hypothetical protein
LKQRVEALGWGVPVQGFPWPRIQLGGPIAAELTTIAACPGMYETKLARV